MILYNSKALRNVESKVKQLEATSTQLEEFVGNARQLQRNSWNVKATKSNFNAIRGIWRQREATLTQREECEGNVKQL